MIRRETEAAVELSTWYARLGRASTPATTPAEGQPNSFPVGPLTVFHLDRNASLTTFGSAGSPSVALVDGFFFDRSEIARALGVNVGQATNAEIVAAAYERWGSELFNELPGRYLAAVWDARAERLVLGHDALGRHPVYFCPTPDGVWFSCNLLALAGSGRVSAQPNRVSLALGLLSYWPEAGQTYLEQVRRLRPGHRLEVTKDLAVAELKYWDPFPSEDEPWMSDEAALERFEPALKRAVARCEALNPTGIMLSGGVDSVTIAALAAEYRQAHGLDPLIAVCGQTGYELSGEEQMQARVAKALHMPLRVSTTIEWQNGRDDVSLSLELTPDLPGPTDVWWVGTYISFYRRTAAQHISVLLTGAGGDNWLGVAPHHSADLLRRFRLAELQRFVKADVATGGASMRTALRRHLWTSGLRLHVDSEWATWAPAAKTRYHRRRWHERLPPWLFPAKQDREALVERLLGYRQPSLTPSGRRPTSHYRHHLRSVDNSYMHYETEIAYHMESLAGVRLLSPYHDADLVQFLNRISPRALLHGTRYKGLLRPVVKKYLPTLGLENQRKEYELGHRARVLAALRDGIAAAWRGQRFTALADLGIVDAPRAARQIDDLQRLGSGGLAKLFALIDAERWLTAMRSRPRIVASPE